MLNRQNTVGVVFLIASSLFVVFGLSGLQTNTEDVLQWLPDKSNAREHYDFFQCKFGQDDFVVVSWDGCTTSDPRLKRFVAWLRQNDSQELIGDIASADEVSDRLSQLGISQKQIRNRLRGIFLSADGNGQTLVFAELTQKGTESRRDSMALIWNAIDSTENLSRNDVVIGGYPYIAVSIDGQLNNSFRNFLLPSVVLATLVSLFCLRNLTLAIIVFITSTGAGLCSIAAIPAFGFKFGGLMSIIPALVFVLATSGTIHLIRYSLDAPGDSKALLRVGWKPCAVSAITTAIGMLSLCRSSFPAIRNFGLFCAVGVGFTLVFQLMMVPWLLDRFGINGQKKLLARQSGNWQKWQSLVSAIERFKSPIVVFSLVLFVAAIFGLTRLVAEVEVEKLFHQDSKVILDLKDMEQRLGPLEQTELLVVFDGVDDERFVERSEIVRQLHRSISKLPQVGVVYSLINFLPNQPSRSNIRNAVKRSIYQMKIRQQRSDLANGDLLNVNDNSETWRICLRFPFTKSHDFKKLKDDVLAKCQTVANHPANDSPRFLYTGKSQLFNHAQMTLLVDLFRNFLLAFAIITPILIFVLKSLRIGLIAMLPNLFPIVVMFGGFGWIGFPVDLAIAMTACVALGIAVDDTTHFLVRFRDFGGSLDNASEPMIKTIGQCGPAMLHTTLIAGAGLVVYIASEMLVMSRFAWAITAMLIVAVVADLIILPAVLFLFAKTKNR